jgi:hypothetical protein
MDTLITVSDVKFHVNLLSERDAVTQNEDMNREIEGKKGAKRLMYLSFG